VQVVIGLVRDVLGVFLAQQARRRLQRGQQRAALDELGEVGLFGDDGAGQHRAVGGDGHRYPGLPGFVHRVDQLPQHRIAVVLSHTSSLK
jgi:hypothetical protein